MSHYSDAELEALLDHQESDKAERKESWLGSSPRKDDRLFAPLPTISPITMHQAFSSLEPITTAIRPTSQLTTNYC